MTRGLVLVAATLATVTTSPRSVVWAFLIAPPPACVIESAWQAARRSRYGLIRKPTSSRTAGRRYGPQSRSLTSAENGRPNHRVARATSTTEAHGDGLGLDVDPESLARAREAAKQDDYEWFMEFIGSNENDGSNSSSPSSGARSRDSAISADERNDQRSGTKGFTEAGDGRDVLNKRDDASRAASRRRVSYGDDDNFDRSKDVTQGGMDARRSTARRPRYRDSPSASTPPAPRFDQPQAGVSRRRRRPTAADAAYDYDLDDEFNGEPGRGGWEYDTGLTAGVGARRRDVDVGRARARAKAAARRAPLEEDDEDIALREEPTVEDVKVATFEPVGPAKADVLTNELGYTAEEVACMDPEMADLALERRIRRPARGMPRDWVGAGATPKISGDGAEAALGPQYHDEDDVLYGGTRGARQRGRGVYGSQNDVPSSPPIRSRRTQPRPNNYGYDDGNYDDYDDDEEEQYVYGGRPGGGSRGGDFEMRGERRRGGGGRRATRRKRELDPAEVYERNLLGGPDEDDEDDRIWTGVGPNGPWPTYEEFTQLLRDETDVRLSLVGPWAADVVALENSFRLNAYKMWLDVLDKGIGESLADAGVFDAAFIDEDDDAGTLYDSYTSYGSGRGSAQGYDPRGLEDETGFDRDGGDSQKRRERPSAGASQARRRRGRRESEFNVGSFLKSGADTLKSGAEKLMQPAEGMEEQAARFERNYPGARQRRRPQERGERAKEARLEEESRPRDAQGRDRERRSRLGGEEDLGRGRGAALSGSGMEDEDYYDW